MAPNGYDAQDDEGQAQSRTFRDVMEEALEAIRTMAEADDAASYFVDLIIAASDVPEQARPFVKQLEKVQKATGDFDEKFPEDESEINKEEVAAMLEGIKSSCDELVLISESNPALKAFSEKLRREMQMMMTVIGAMAGCSDETKDAEDLKAGLNDLFGEQDQ